MMSLPSGLSTMKTPRVQDFDPNAKLPELASPLDNLPSIKPAQKKQLHSSIIEELKRSGNSSELHDHSVYFKPQNQTEPPTERTPDRTNARTPVRRQLTRYAFEFYQDQVEDLRRIALEEKMQGGKGSMSEMVREAMDKYLEKKKPLGK